MFIDLIFIKLYYSIYEYTFDKTIIKRTKEMKK
jgi:hypothetical protein